MSTRSVQMLTFAVKKHFIDVRKVRDRARRQRLGILRRIGSIYRRIMRKKLRKGPAFSKKVAQLRGLAFSGDADAMARLKKLGVFTASPAGTPPKTRSPDPNLRMILYALDGDEIVVIGPVAFPTAKGKTVPELHELGGSLRVHNRFSGKSFIATYPERPFAWPTLNENEHVIEESIEKIGLI